MNDSDPEDGPFSTLYGEWFAGPSDARDPRIAAQLASSYRKAWQDDVGYDRENILHFLHFHREAAGADLIVEGLKSSDRRLAGEAAVITSVSHRRVFEVGPGLRRAYRDLVRRFPENDTVRPRDLYGHEPDDVDDSDTRPFLNLHEDWRVDEHPFDPTITQRLVDTYRSAWAAGDGIERAFVLHFLLTNKRPTDPAHKVDGTDLVIEGLSSEDARLGPTAAFAVWCMTKDGVDFGPGLREILVAHRARFGRRYGPSLYVLQDLDDQAKAQSDATQA